MIACATVNLRIKGVQELLGCIHTKGGPQTHALFFRLLSRSSLSSWEAEGSIRLLQVFCVIRVGIIEPSKI